MQKNKYNIAVMPGDGIGTEVMPEALKVLNIVSNKYGINLHFDHFDFSSYEYYSKHGQMMPDDWKKQIEEHDALFFGSVGWPALKKYKDNIIRYYIGDVGALNQIIHVWQFEDDNSRRELWKTIYNDKKFIKFASEFRPLVLTQENKLMTAAPWTPFETI